MLYVLDNFQKIGMIETFRSIIWNTQFYGQGEMQIVIPASREYIELCEYGRMLVRQEDAYITSGGDLAYKNVMVIQEIIYRENDSEGAVLQLIGRSLKSYLLGKRVVEGATQMTGNASDLLRLAVLNNAMSSGSRGIENFRLGYWPPIEGNIDIQVEGESLAELCEKVGRDAKFGWDVIITASKYVFTLNAGKERTRDSRYNPVIFSRKYDNLASMEFQMNFLDYHNTILVQGEARDSFNGRVWTQNRATEYSGIEREEMYLNSDAQWETDSGELTEEQYKNTLRGLGKRDLNMINPYSFTADIIPNGIFTLNKSYYLGDIVEIETEVGINAKARIVEVIEAIDEQGKSTVLTFEEWEVL